ncbi:transglycosylase domain-containing protein [Oceanobacillus sp. CAU 1775]
MVIVFFMGPPPIAMEESTTVYSANNVVIGVDDQDINRQKISIDELPRTLKAGTILIEDQHFYKHYGFDFKRIVGAMWKNIRTGSLKEGASTITQQLARNLYLTHEKTWERKLKEAFYTIRLEMHYSKDEILEGYLNSIYYGHGAYGIKAASEHFFNKTESELTDAEIAMLIGIPKGPTYYSPLNNEENANARKDMILLKMWYEKILSDADYHTARQQKLIYAPLETSTQPTFAPHFHDIVLEEAASILEITKEEIRSSGYQIFTTLDENLQETLEQALQEKIPGDSELEAAAMSVNPMTGAVLSMAGGRDYKQSEFNRAVMAERMPGSTFKPFLYYAALERGYTPLTKQMSKPTTFKLSDGKSYQPSNFNHYYANKPITLAQAIALSDNVYAVRTNLFLGAETLARTANKFGFKNDFPAVPSLALGTAVVSLEEVVSAYAMLANGGKTLETYTIDKIIDRNGKTIFEHSPGKQKQALDPRTTFILSHLLTGTFNPKLNGYMPVTGTSISHKLSREYAGKSGTTPNDNWMVGYSPSVVTGVWTGYDDHRIIENVADAAYAKEIWAEVMEAAHAGLPQDSFPTPRGVIGLPIDIESGLRAAPGCGESIIMYFLPGTEPTDYCQQQQEEPSNQGLFEKWFQLFFN